MRTEVDFTCSVGNCSVFRLGNESGSHGARLPNINIQQDHTLDFSMHWNDGTANTIKHIVADDDTFMSTYNGMETTIFLQHLCCCLIVIITDSPDCDFVQMMQQTENGIGTMCI